MKRALLLLMVLNIAVSDDKYYLDVYITEVPIEAEENNTGKNDTKKGKSAKTINKQSKDICYLHIVRESSKDEKISETKIENYENGKGKDVKDCSNFEYHYEFIPIKPDNVLGLRDLFKKQLREKQIILKFGSLCSGTLNGAANTDYSINITGGEVKCKSMNIPIGDDKEVKSDKKYLTNELSKRFPIDITKKVYDGLVEYKNSLNSRSEDSKFEVKMLESMILSYEEKRIVKNITISINNLLIDEKGNSNKTEFINGRKSDNSKELKTYDVNQRTNICSKLDKTKFSETLSVGKDLTIISKSIYI